MRKQIVDELHRDARRRFPRRRVIVKGLSEIWQADLVEMQEHSVVNKGYRYLLTVIDIFSKYAWAKPLLDKTGLTVVKAFKEIFDDSKTHPSKLQTDFGREFYNKHFKKLMKDYKVHHYSTFSSLKVSQATHMFSLDLNEFLIHVLSFFRLVSSRDLTDH